MSCRHDLALGTCSRCYPDSGTIDPGEEPTQPSLDGPGALPLEELLSTPEGRAQLSVTLVHPIHCLGLYQHFMGNQYYFVGEATHSESLEPLIIYRSLDNGKLWARPKDSFFENVTLEDGSSVPRFKKL